MREIIWGFVILLLFTACGNRKTKLDPFEPLTDLVNSVKERELDSVMVTLEEDTLKPVKADEVFDDFIYSFATNEEMQLQRIIFPLPYYNMNTTSKIEKKDWRQDKLFIRQQYYTILFDREEDMELVQDTSLNSVQFEWVYLKEQVVKKYYFERKKGMWFLEAINKHEMESGENENFVNFFYRFTNDSIFQTESVKQPLTFITTDPDDDFSILETTIEQNQWLAFMPVLPKERLTNINYGQKNESDSQNKILVVKGINNGFFNALYFRQEEKKWRLYKFEDLSN